MEEMSPNDALFNRTELLLGIAGMERLAATRVILFGVGGVGSWCAECLIRSGVGHLTIVDSDRVCPTNLNRQLQATSLPVKLLSSMGAALKLDPTKIRVAEFWKITYCPLARSLRKKFKHWQKFPKQKFQCVYSPEVLENQGDSSEDSMPEEFNKVQVNGSLAHITAIFGFMLAGTVVQLAVSS